MSGGAGSFLAALFFRWLSPSIRRPSIKSDSDAILSAGRGKAEILATK
jgi:hypothetical protein